MKTPFFLIIMLISSLLLAQQEVSFTGVSPKAGQTLVRSTTYKMDVNVILKFAGESLQEYNEISTATIRKAETVLETNRDAITKLRVTYEMIERQAVKTEDGIPEKEKFEKSPVLGQTYVVTAEQGVTKVTDANGLKPSNREIEIVQGDYDDLGKVDSFLQFLKQKNVQVGEPLQMPGVLAESIFTDSQHRRVKVDEASFVLKTVRQNIAVFDTALKMQWNEDANTSIKMNLTGETLVGIQNSRMVTSALSGTVRVTGAEQLYNRLVMVDGKGKMTITENLKVR